MTVSLSASLSVVLCITDRHTQVEEAVLITSKGEVIAKKGGPLMANTWWDGVPATDYADCSTWTHLEVAKQQLNSMKMQVQYLSASDSLSHHLISVSLAFTVSHYLSHCLTACLTASLLVTHCLSYCLTACLTASLLVLLSLFASRLACLLGPSLCAARISSLCFSLLSASLISLPSRYAPIL